MTMKTYQINGKKLKDWESFHAEFKVEMGFPKYYGNNMDAWIDCVDELSLTPTLIEISHGDILKSNAPELLGAILECAAFINYRKVKAGGMATLMVSVSTS